MKIEILGAISALVFVTYLLASCAGEKKCHERGGAYVQSVWWFECVERNK